MATRYSMGTPTIESKPKKTAQGRGQHTKYAATSRNKANNGSNDAVSSITSSSSVATVTLSSHGVLAGDLIVIAGCTGGSAPYNGTFKVKANTDANVLTYDLPVQPADATAQGTPT